MTSSPKRARTRPGIRRQGGAFAIMFVPILLLLIGFCGLALDAGQIYNRMVDLHGMARAVAIAAAHELNGTPAGIAAAQAKARQTAESLRFKYFGDGSRFAWNDAALTFSSGYSRSGTWYDGSSTGGKEAELFYVKVDTAGLDSAITTINTFFIRIMSASLSAIRLSDSAVAGRTGISVTPLGICAMGAAASTRVHTGTGGVTLAELVQYGFRRGVSYDLMKLNPNNTQPARYVINPVATPGTPAGSFNTAALPPFLCAGTMWVPRVTGGSIRVTPLPSTSPLAAFHTALNSRFDVYAGGQCNASGAPPDYNVKEYKYDVAGTVKWMTPSLGSAAAASTTTRGKLETVADLTSPPASAGDYGPLWAHAKAVKAPSPLTAPEPANGYTTFATSDWAALYKLGPTTSTYPTNAPTPYQSISTANGHYQAPQAANLEISTLNRRVLNIPLLECSPAEPTSANSPATVLAIGKFFMTVQATQDKLIGEFAGVASTSAMSGPVEEFP